MTRLRHKPRSGERARNNVYQAPRVCSSGKVAFRSRKDARTIKVLQHAKGQRNIQEYRCPECGHYHLGNRPPAQILSYVRERRA